MALKNSQFWSGRVPCRDQSPTSWWRFRTWQMPGPAGTHGARAVVDEYQVAAIFHPNVWYWHGSRQMRGWHAESIRRDCFSYRRTKAGGPCWPPLQEGCWRWPGDRSPLPRKRRFSTAWGVRFFKSGAGNRRESAGSNHQTSSSGSACPRQRRSDCPSARPQTLAESPGCQKRRREWCERQYYRDKFI
jgi:hypothetical protein